MVCTGYVWVWQRCARGLSTTSNWMHPCRILSASFCIGFVSHHCLLCCICKPPCWAAARCRMHAHVYMALMVVYTHIYTKVLKTRGKTSLVRSPFTKVLKTRGKTSLVRSPLLTYACARVYGIDGCIYTYIYQSAQNTRQNQPSTESVYQSAQNTRQNQPSTESVWQRFA